MSTALGTTVGTGNIVGVVLSLSIGGPGICRVFACFGIGNMTQAKAISANLEHSFSISPYLTAGVLAVGTAAALLGGIRTVKRLSLATALSSPWSVGWALSPHSP